MTSALLDDETAKTDAIYALKTDYRGDLRLEFWGREMVSERLRQHPVVVEAYFGEAWAKAYCGQRYSEDVKKRAEVERIRGVLQDAVGGQYDAGNKVHFKQIDLTGTSVDSLFVDVPATAAGDPETEWYIDELAGSSTAVGAPNAGPKVGAAQLLLSQGWSRSAVIVGGPGQGKTTLLQYLTQFHRARVLGRLEYSPIAAGLEDVTSIHRFPVSVSLPEYADWRAERLAVKKSKPKNPRGAKDNRNVPPDPTKTSLEAYLAVVIGGAAGCSFTRDHLEVALLTQPLLIALDSLDEIAAPDVREDVAQEIIRAQVRIQRKAIDAVILVATRPGHVGQPIWRSREFASIFLGRLTPALRMKYFERWAAETQQQAEDVERLRDKFIRALALEHVAELAGNPMQLAILLHLMVRREMIPERRTELYDAYMDVFMDREAKLLEVGKNRESLIGIFSAIAWWIQVEVETGKSASTIGIDQIREIVENYQGARRSATRVPDSIFESFTGRVLCLVERGLGSGEFEFDVQSLREYFVARYMYDRAAIATIPQVRSEMFSAMLRRPYWLNVLRFFSGKMTHGEIPIIPHLLREFQADDKVGKHPISRSVAKTLLSDGLFRGHLVTVISDIWSVLLDGAGLVLAGDGLMSDEGQPLEFGDQENVDEFVNYLTSRRYESLTDLAAVGRLLAQAADADTVSRVWPSLGETAPGVWLDASRDCFTFPNSGSPLILGTAMTMLDAGVESPVTQSLARLDFCLASEELVDACIRQLANGEGGGFAGGGVFAKLIQSAQPWSLQAGNPLTADGVQSVRVAAGRRIRRRTGGHDDAMSRHFARVNEVVAKRGTGTIRSEFQDLESIWGVDSWPVLLSTLTIRPEDVPAEATGSLATAGLTWGDAAAWVVEAKGRRSDSQWWSTELKAATSSGSTQSAVVLSALAVFASSSTLMAVADDAQVSCQALSRPQLSSLVDAVRGLHRADGRGRRADLADGVRRGSFHPGADYALLLWSLCTDRTQERLARGVLASFSDLGFTDPISSEILRHSLLVDKRRASCVEFRGLRLALPYGALKIESMKPPTFVECDAILANPGDWPADVVRFAADHLGSRLANLPALGIVAADKNWFDNAVR